MTERLAVPSVLGPLLFYSEGKSFGSLSTSGGRAEFIETLEQFLLASHGSSWQRAAIAVPGLAVDCGGGRRSQKR